ncbi:MAG: hypothetical protein KatS3mg111_2654 [Pirellulaceae bacterium]|nr:MAG: hypothetical protein KatS3mg111_2654 [Pirellulaceae bacterium]
MATIEDVRRKIARYGKTAINEQNTKATLIQPILRALDWDVEDLEDVHMEYRQQGRDKPVDYALMIRRTPCMFVEAKALQESLDDRRWANQIMGYASVAGVQWVVLTNGDEYRIYNSHAAVPVEEKLFRQFRISDPATHPEKCLAMLSKAAMSDRQIDQLWDAYFVDRQVAAAVEALFGRGDGPSPSLVRLIRRSVPTLKTSEIEASLRRMEFNIDFPTPELHPTAAAPNEGSSTASPAGDRTRASTAASASDMVREKPEPKKSTKKKRSIRTYSTTISDLIARGVLSPPVPLTARYRRRALTATIEADGTIHTAGQSFPNPTAAALHAIRNAGLSKRSINGWDFWRITLPDGRTQRLGELR